MDRLIIPPPLLDRPQGNVSSLSLCYCSEISQRNTRKSSTVRPFPAEKRTRLGLPQVWSEDPETGGGVHGLTGLIIQYRGINPPHTGHRQGCDNTRGATCKLARGDNAGATFLSRQTWHIKTKPSMRMLREIIHGSYLYASASRHASPGAAVGGFTVCLPTITRPPDTSSARANRWTNAQCF